MLFLALAAALQSAPAPATVPLPSPCDKGLSGIWHFAASYEYEEYSYPMFGTLSEVAVRGRPASGRSPVELYTVVRDFQRGIGGRTLSALETCTVTDIENAGLRLNCEIVRASSTTLRPDVLTLHCAPGFGWSGTLGTGRGRDRFSVRLTRQVEADPGLETAAVEDAGPYVERDGANWVVRSPEGHRKDRTLSPGQDLTVLAVGEAPAFKVRVRPEAVVEPDQIVLPGAAPILVVADTHGQYEPLVRLLQRQGVIDDDLRWSYGEGHLVVLGDIFDRGERQTEILWLLYELERQAAETGGGLHVVLGNHEAMNLANDIRYLDYRYRDAPHDFEVERYSDLFGPASVLGQWIRTWPAILKINSDLFVHGGLSPALAASGRSIPDINAGVRASLGSPPSPGDLLTGDHGPLWYRGYFGDEEQPAAVTPDEVGTILHHFGARRVFVGHTIVDQVETLFGGRVVAVQVRPLWEEREDEPSLGAVLLGPNGLETAWPNGNRTAVEAK